MTSIAVAVFKHSARTAQ